MVYKKYDKIKLVEGIDKSHIICTSDNNVQMITTRVGTPAAQAADNREKGCMSLMTPDQADELATTLNHYADEARGCTKGSGTSDGINRLKKAKKELMMNALITIGFPAVLVGYILVCATNNETLMLIATSIIGIPALLAFAIVFGKIWSKSINRYIKAVATEQ